MGYLYSFGSSQRHSAVAMWPTAFLEDIPRIYSFGRSRRKAGYPPSEGVDERRDILTPSEGVRGILSWQCGLQHSWRTFCESTPSEGVDERRDILTPLEGVRGILPWQCGLRHSWKTFRESTPSEGVVERWDISTPLEGVEGVRGGKELWYALTPPHLPIAMRYVARAWRWSQVRPEM